MMIRFLATHHQYVSSRSAWRRYRASSTGGAPGDGLRLSARVAVAWDRDGAHDDLGHGSAKAQTSATRPALLRDDVHGAVLHVAEDVADILGEHAEHEELHAAQEEHRAC